MTDIVNKPAAAVNEIIAGTIAAEEKAIDIALETGLDTAAPFFALPVVHQISDVVIEQVVHLIAQAISIRLQQVGTFIVIDTQVTLEQHGISDALANLMKAEKSGDPVAIQAAIQYYANAQSALVHDDGSAPAH